MKDMKKLSYSQLKAIFRSHEATMPADHLTGCIVFCESGFPLRRSPEARTFRVSSNNKAFKPNMFSKSIFGDSLDGLSLHYRLNEYMAEEQGGKDGWKVDYCYLNEEELSCAGQ